MVRTTMTVIHTDELAGRLVEGLVLVFVTRRLMDGE